jgi:hypothetical protein
MATDSVDTDEIVNDAVTLAKIDADSSTTARGVIEQATDDETRTGSDTDRATSPSNITALFGHSSRTLQATEGFQLLPGGLLLKWGADSGAGPITFENTIAFSAVYNVTASQVSASGENNASVQCHTVTTTGMTVSVSQVGATFNYFVVGKA